MSAEREFDIVVFGATGFTGGATEYLAANAPASARWALAGRNAAKLAAVRVDLVHLRHHATAVPTGARLVHACGFDSIPYDLGVLFTVGHLPQDRPIHVDGFIRAEGLPAALWPAR